MKTKELLWAYVAIVMYVLGICAFASAEYAHVWHILSVPTYQVTATFFVIANLAVTVLFGAQKGYAFIMLIQASGLWLVLTGVNVFVPICAYMAKGMMYPTLGMISIAITGKIMSKVLLGRSVSYPKSWM
ncbi:MAG: hypothetical protein IJ660_03385 [Alphaproteobacteria bacterium]|nr:hypothetical protein [Alphaproteobacteria bacterium]